MMRKAEFYIFQDEEVETYIAESLFIVDEENDFYYIIRLINGEVDEINGYTLHWLAVETLKERRELEIYDFIIDEKLRNILEQILDYEETRRFFTLKDFLKGYLKNIKGE